MSCSTYLEQQEPEQSNKEFTMNCSPGWWWSQEDNVFQSGCRSSRSLRHNVHHQEGSPLDRSGCSKYRDTHTRTQTLIRLDFLVVHILWQDFICIIICIQSQAAIKKNEACQKASQELVSSLLLRASPSDVLNRAFLVLTKELFA